MPHLNCTAKYQIRSPHSLSLTKPKREQLYQILLKFPNPTSLSTAYEHYPTHGISDGLMAAPAVKDALTTLQNLALPLSKHIDAFRTLKSAATGCSQNKTDLVELGGLEVLDHVLTATIKSKGKQKGVASAPEPEIPRFRGLQPLGEEDQILFEAVGLFGLLAQDGALFVEPILATSMISTVASCISSSTCPSIISLAALRGLAVFTEPDKISHTDLSVFKRWSTFKAIAEVLTLPSTATLAPHLVVLACKLLKNVIRDDKQRDMCVQAGIVDHLASRLVSYHVLKNPQMLQQIAESQGLLPAMSKQRMPVLVAALTQIVSGSRYRVARLLYAEPMLKFLPVCPLEVSQAANAFDPRTMGQTMSACDPRIFKALPQHQLPYIHPGHQKENGFSKNFPALSSLSSFNKNTAFVEMSEVQQFAPDRGSDMLESSFIPWLLLSMRTEYQHFRFEVIRLLVAIFKTGWISANRERAFAMLVVPTLITEMTNPWPQAKAPNNNPPKLPLVESLDAGLEAAQLPAHILGELLQGNKALAQAAYEAKIIKHACVFLKKSFDPVKLPPRQWNPRPAVKTSDMNMESIPDARRIGQQGLPASIKKAFNEREAALFLLMAVAQDGDRNRKDICDNNAIQFAADCLTPLDVKVLSQLKEGSKLDAKLGNPSPVLVAACDFIRTVARSVSVLRTSLIDGGVAKPIITLFQHPERSVVQAATDAICNLALESSPMREQLTEAHVVTILCRQAHSLDPELRLASLWALKAICHVSADQIRIRAFDQLGKDWILEVLTADDRLSTSAAHYDEDQSMDTSADPSPGNANNADDAAPLDKTFIALPSNYQHVLRTIRKDEDDAAARKPQESLQEIRVKTMEFLRNIFSAPGNGNKVLIDYVFNAWGIGRTLSMLHGNLDPPPASSYINGNTVPIIDPGHPSVPTIRAALYVCLHVAAGTPSHRAALVAQRPLMLALLRLLMHPDPTILIPVAWTVHNMCWVDDQTDAVAARERARTLRDLGFLEKMHELQKRDSLNIDVRERCKDAEAAMTAK